MAGPASLEHCRRCNRDYLQCPACGQAWATNLATCPPVLDHPCNPDTPTKDKAKAAAAGAAGGAAAGAATAGAATAAAPAALGAAGFGSSGVIGGSWAAATQGALYAGATPAGGWFATATSAAMGGAAGTAAIATAAACAGVAVAAGAGYGLYRLVKGRSAGACPWCGGHDSPQDPPGKGKQAKGGKDVKGGVAVGDHFFRTEEEMVQFALKLSLEEVGEDGQGVEDGGRSPVDVIGLESVREQFLCPICASLMAPPLSIWQCGEGHVVCGGCYKRLEACPVCRGSWTCRNRAMETLAQSLAL